GGDCATTLAVGATCTMDVTFTPSAPGARSATMSITGAIPANTATVNLSGLGLGPILAAAPTSVTFAPQLQGTTSLVAQTVTVSNTGTGPLSAMSVTLGGANAADFAQTGGTCPADLAVNASCTITLTFTPSAMGARSATLSISGAFPANTVVVTLSGTGTAPVVGAAPPSVVFGEHLILDQSGALTVTVSNTGTAPLNAINFTIGGANPTSFSQSGGTCGTTLGVNSSCAIGVVFTPQVLGPLSATLTVTGAVPANSATVNLSGTGTPPPANPSPNPVAFGTRVAHSLVSIPVVVTNVGKGPISFTPSTVTGANYTKTGDTCAGTVVAVGGTCTITVTLNPTPFDDAAVTTANTGTLTVANSGGNVNVPLSATVTQAVIEMGDPGLTTGGTNLKSGTLTVNNVGSAPFIVSSAVVTGTGFTMGANSCTTIQPGSNCSVVIDYNPGGSTTTRTGTLTLTGSGAFSSTLTTTFQAN
ncbi:MAG TPA: choice-of-anchor D domain-containing protein, partial [Candidatus Acidoferrales bacterium]|nr:choice-of-anchor D domain-containing protein [Candidatus Acidoferrales bacterium]